jgi:hypothetical protein
MNFTEQTPQNSTFAKLLAGCIIAAVMVLFGVLSSCKSNEKRQAKMYGKFDKLKRKADSDSVLKVVPSKWSLDNFPLTVGKGKTVYIPGRKIPVPVHDTEYVQIDCDSAIKALGAGNGKVKIKPRDSIRVDTFYRVDSIIDPRPQALCNAEIKRLQTEISNQQVLTQKAIDKAQIAKDKLQNRTNKMWWSIGLNIWWLLLIIIFILRKFGILKV